MYKEERVPKTRLAMTKSLPTEFTVSSLYVDRTQLAASTLPGLILARQIKSASGIIINFRSLSLLDKCNALVV